jgi:hypothetical protein
MIQAPGACTVKHYGFVMYEFCNKIMCLSKPRIVANNSNKALAYYGICGTLRIHNVLQYKPPGANIIKLFFFVTYEKA